MNTHPAILETDEDALRLTRLTELARLVDDWRTAKSIPKDKMSVRFKGLIKSYRNIERICAGQLDELNIETNLTQLESVWSLINSPAPRPTVKPYDDFNVALQLRNAFLRTMAKTGPNRVIILTAPTGRGKSKALEVLRERYRARLVTLSASRVWKDKPMALLSEIWAALGKNGGLGFGRVALKNVEDALKANRIAVAIDEAHYLGPEQLNTITTLVNSTPGEFILAGQPTLWSRLENDRGAYYEARQLTKNRLSCRIRVADLADGDPEVRYLLERRLPWLGSDAEKGAAMMMRHAAGNGNLGMVRNVIERCEEAIDEGAPQAWETFAQALQQELNER